MTLFLWVNVIPSSFKRTTAIERVYYFLNLFQLNMNYCQGCDFDPHL